MSNELEFNEKLEKIESSVLNENLEDISPLVENTIECQEITPPESVNSENVEMSDCSCLGGCGSNYRYDGCSCLGNCGANYRK